MFLSYAKINFGLIVRGKRPDGYHNIETVFHRIMQHDEIEFEPSHGISVSSSDPLAPGDATNICHKAATLLQSHFGIADGVHIILRKRIPVGAGLGGGSSDAATVLRELPAFWKRQAAGPELKSLALQLGSDVPYFLGKESAWAGGRGEVLEYFRLDVPYTILVCYPGIHVSTAWAYQHVQPGDPGQRRALKELILEGMKDPASLAHTLQNDFEPVVFKTHPVVSRVKQEMLDAGAGFAAMTGSGSSVYGLFSDENSAARVASLFDDRGHKTSLTPPHFALP